MTEDNKGMLYQRFKLKEAERVEIISLMDNSVDYLPIAGKEYEQRINQTVKALKRINPKLVAPSHCTGWRKKCKIAEEMPKTFVWNSVGNLYTL